MRTGGITLTRRVGDGIALTSMLLLVGAIATSYLADPSAVISGVLTAIGLVGGFGSVGWVLVRRLPGNPIGWSLSVAGLLWGVMTLAHGWVALALSGRIAVGPLERVCALIDTWGWSLSMPFAVPLPLLLLPDGRLLSRRWRPAVWAVLGGGIVGAVGYATTAGRIDDVPPYGHLVNPLGVTELGQLPQILSLAGAAIGMVGALAGVVAIILRYRRSRGIERQQLRWVALGGCSALVGIAASTGSSSEGVLPLTLWFVMVVGIAAVPVCIGIAVLRYRLYDLGRLVSRTVSFAVVSAILLGVYVSLVTLTLELLPSDSPVAVAGSTLAAAALFQPLRKRVQSVAEKRFNRARYDADLTSAAFGRTVRNEVELDVVSRELTAVIHQTLQPVGVSLWMKGAGP